MEQRELLLQFMNTLSPIKGVEYMAYWVVSVSIPLMIAYCLLLRKRFGDIDRIPGPFLARWTPFWLAYHVRLGQRYQAVHRLHEKYGVFARISPNHVSIADKDAIAIIYGHGSKALQKSAFYDAFVNETPSVFSTVGKEDHSRKRRLVAHAFSSQSLQHFTTFLENNMHSFVCQMDRICESSRSVNALLWFNYLSFDILSDLVFGEPIGMIKNASDIVTVQDVNGETFEEHAISIVDEREHLATIIGLHPSFNFLTRLIPDPFFIRAHKSSVALGNLARRQVLRRLQVPSTRVDILAKLIETHRSDTSSSSISAIIFLILTHPQVYKKLMDTLDSAIKSEEPTYEEVKDIPYLDATINEGYLFFPPGCQLNQLNKQSRLRYHATTAIGLHRVVPEGGITCCGVYFPPGTEISVPAWTIQRDPKIWTDPNVFRPERWLESADLKPFLLTFGKGSRACLGRNLAYMEMRIVIATVLTRYTLQLESDVLITKEGFMHKPLHLMAKFQRRQYH
ncbi:benzoate para-hydroxylase [Crucibulum laeve]|uniref:Benzoate para-hydroxylase n=1 Tax=Crucibulum laeve TaxID=68775 RepID=A0A5C3LPW5_9AGAR|nr:benzoate para-hydroxylase [Crucibulum laeve]